MDDSPSPPGSHAMDWTFLRRSIVFLHTPSSVQTLTPRPSLVSSRLPLGDHATCPTKP